MTTIVGEELCEAVDVVPGERQQGRKISDSQATLLIAYAENIVLLI